MTSSADKLREQRLLDEREQALKIREEAIKVAEEKHQDEQVYKDARARALDDHIRRLEKKIDPMKTLVTTQVDEEHAKLTKAREAVDAELDRLADVRQSLKMARSELAELRRQIKERSEYLSGQETQVEATLEIWNDQLKKAAAEAAEYEREKEEYLREKVALVQDIADLEADRYQHGLALDAIEEQVRLATEVKEQTMASYRQDLRNARDELARAEAYNEKQRDQYEELILSAEIKQRDLDSRLEILRDQEKQLRDDQTRLRSDQEALLAK